MKHLRWGFVLFLIAAPTAPLSYSSSMIMNQIQSANSESYCEVIALFKQDRHQDTVLENRKTAIIERITKVSWQFQVESLNSINKMPCPTGNIFELYLPMVEHSVLPDGTHTDVYPDFVKIPAKETTLLLKLKKIHIRETHYKNEKDDWILVNWRDGIEVL